MSEINITKTRFEKFADNLFIVTVCLIVIIKMMESVAFLKPFIEFYSDNGRYYIYLLMLPRLFAVKFSREKIILLILSCILFIISFFFAQTTVFLLIVFAAICGMNININKVLRSVLIAKLIFFCVAICLYFLGQTTGSTAIRGDIIRNHLGFGHPNHFGIQAALIVALWLYFRYKNLKIIDFIFLFLFWFVNYKFVDSRTSLIITLMLGLLFFSSKYNKRMLNNRIIKLFCILLPLTLPAIFVYLASPAVAENEFYLTMDSLFSGRLRYNKLVYRIYELRAWGYKDINVREHFLIVDNNYISVIYKIGVIPFIIIMFMFVLLFYRLFKAQNLPMIYILMCICFYASMEGVLFDLSFNFVALFLLSKKEHLIYYDRGKTSKFKIKLISGGRNAIRYNSIHTNI